MPAARLDQLEIDEISGVDHPANLREGYLVIKSRDGKGVHMLTDAEIAEVVKAASDLQNQQTQLTQALQSSSTLLADAPTNVKEAHQILLAWMQELPAPATEEAKTKGFMQQLVQYVTGSHGSGDEIEKAQFEALVKDIASGKDVKELTATGGR
jgi:hypothetical protein